MSTSSTPSVLSVEDNPETRLLLEHLLADHCDLTLAPSVDEALKAVDSEPFDLLLLDINLGEEKTGTELLHLIRAREEMARVPAIALTAFAMPGDREDLLDKGFDGYVGKPFSQKELTNTIDQTLSGASGR